MSANNLQLYSITLDVLKIPIKTTVAIQSLWTVVISENKSHNLFDRERIPSPPPPSSSHHLLCLSGFAALYLPWHCTLITLKEIQNPIMIIIMNLCYRDNWNTWLPSKQLNKTLNHLGDIIDSMILHMILHPWLCNLHIRTRTNVSHCHWNPVRPTIATLLGQNVSTSLHRGILHQLAGWPCIREGSFYYIHMC